MIAEIKYNGELIAELSAVGQRATLKCKGAKMGDDISIIGSAAVLYDGVQIAQSTAQKVTLKSKDKIMLDAIAVELQATAGLVYGLSADGTYYTCTGRGTATGTDIVIASEIDGVPVTAIGENAFNGDTTLTGIFLPTSITTIGANAFTGCENLSKVAAGSGAFYGFASNYGANIEYFCILDMGDNTSLYIDSYITAANCPKLKTLMLPVSPNFNSWKQAGFAPVSEFILSEHESEYSTIDGNLYLYGDFVNIGSGLSLKNYATGKDEKVFIVPDGVIAISGYACHNAKFEEVIIPASVTSIGMGAFGSCANLKKITYGGTRAQWGASVSILGFAGGSSQMTIVCSDETFTYTPSA